MNEKRKIRTIPETNLLGANGPRGVLHLRLLKSVDNHGNNLYRVTRRYRHHDGTIVPAGFVTNMGTIPRALHAFVTPSTLREAAVVHDYNLGEFGSRRNRTNRQTADRRLLRDMEIMGFGLVRRWSIYGALRFYALVSGKR